MLGQTFHLLIQTPIETLFEGEVKSLALNTDSGIIEIHPNHAHLIGTLTFSMPRVTIVSQDSGTTEYVFSVRNGSVYFDTESNTCRVLALWGLKREEVTHETVAEYLKFVEETLKQGGSLNSFQLAYLGQEKESLETMVNVTKNSAK